jgi:hypothetical protein
MIFFSTKKAVRQYGELLFLLAIAEMDECNGKDIDNWIVKKFEVKLPSSFIYPTLSKLTGGFVPYVIADPRTRTYKLNPKADVSSLIRPQLAELREFIDKLVDIFE